MFESNAITPLLYKQAFKHDYFSDLMKIAKAMENFDGDLSSISFDDIEHIDFTILDNLAWVCARTADKEVKPLFQWLEENPEFDVMEHGSEIMSLVYDSMNSKKKLKNNMRVKNR